MRKVVVSMNVTMNGYVSGMNSEIDWHFQNWTPAMGERLAEELNKADTILLGRNTYESMADYWPALEKDFLFPREDIAFAVMMNTYKKIVYSKKLKSTRWKNSTIIKGELTNEIEQLKQQKPKKNIIVYGSCMLVHSLLQLNLVDEFQLWVHPVILKKGKPLFPGLKEKLFLKFQRSKTFESGVVLLYYKI